MNVAYTPLMIVRRRGQSDIVKALTEAGAADVPDPWELERKRKITQKKVHPKNFADVEKRVAAVRSAVSILDKCAIESLREFDSHEQKCISCHHQLLPLIAINLADAKGIPHDRRLYGELSRQIVVRDTSDAERSEPTLDFGPKSSIEGYTSW